MGRILVGTCSWTDQTLIQSGRFYPQWAKSAEDRLRFYASQFNVVEVDSTYYAMPAEQTARLWVERTPDDFVFDVKAFRLFTQHPTPAKALPKDLREALPPRAGEKANLYQRDYILSCKDRLPQYRVAIEFRQNSWLGERNRETTIRFLRENDLSYVCVDEPQGFKSSVPPVAEATSGIGVVRFHGRNVAMWEKKGATVAQRFDYLYGERELAEWVPRIRDLSSRTGQLHVLFNNCHEDKAVVNAGQIRLMLD